jgi:3-oxoacyl-[acyl-carrier-protein] synthase II
MEKIAAAITGMGAVSPHGRGVGALWKGLLEGRAAFSPITLFDAKPFRNPLAGEVAGYPVLADGPPRAQRMLHDACREALADAIGLSDRIAPGAQAGSAGGEAEADLDRELASRLAGLTGLASAAIVTGTNFGGMSAAERALSGGGAVSPASGAQAADRAASSAGDLSQYLFGAAADHVAAAFGLVGPRFNLSLSCASGVAALGVALDLIRRGQAKAALACGYDELSLFVYAGLSALHAMTPETIRPFDRRRKGTLFSEGAGALMVEDLSHARRRGARIHALVLGRACNNDAYHMTAPEQDARGIQALMRAALADAGTPPEDIGHLNLHATGTQYNDRIEALAIKAVFGPRGSQIPVSAVKSSIGHTMGAAGLLETIAAVLSLREGLAPPILGLDPAEKDPECDLLTPTGKPLAVRFDAALKTSYGFGGTNAAVVLKRQT